MWDVKKGWDRRFFEHLFLQSLFSSVSQFLEEYGSEVVLAVDSPHPWRKQIYEDYKGDRPGVRKKSEMDWDSFYQAHDEIVEMLKESSPFKVVRVDGVEADDIIAWLVYSVFGEKVVISSDKDFVQLLHCSDVKVFDPIRKQFRESEDPAYELFVKIMTGDSGDNIPPVKKGIGTKRARKYWDNFTLLESEGLLELYERNKRLIDLTQIPGDIGDSISECYLESSDEVACPTVLFALLSNLGLPSVEKQLQRMLD